jgi:hypothetical protein
MNAFELLQDFRSRGVLLEVQAGKLRFAPRDAVTPELRDALREHKADLLLLLAEPADPRTATMVAVLTEPGEAAEPAELRTGTAVPVLTDLAVSFLEAVEALLVTIKDERPPSFLTPQLKRDLKATEAALSAYRAELLPDAPESRAVGESLANRYRGLN